MNLHEFQGKQLFREYGLPVSKGFAVTTASDAVEAAKKKLVGLNGLSKLKFTLEEEEKLEELNWLIRLMKSRISPTFG